MAVEQPTHVDPPVLTVPCGHTFEHFVEDELVYPELQVVQVKDVLLGQTLHPWTTQTMLHVL